MEDSANSEYNNSSRGVLAFTQAWRLQRLVDFILPKSKFFPPAELAEPEGVVLFGGRLTPEWLLDAYAHGIFPWPIFDGTDIVVWWSPDPRGIFELDGFRPSRRLLRTCRGFRFE